MKTTFRFTGVAAAIGMTFACAADAQPLCKSGPCVYDSRNTLVGLAWLGSNVVREISGTLYDLNYLETGLTESGLFYFASNNCTGQPYLTTGGGLPRSGFFDGQSIWAPVGGLVDFAWASYSYPAIPANGGQCISYGPCAPSLSCQGTGAPAAKVETPALYPPFKIKLQ